MTDHWGVSLLSKPVVAEHIVFLFYLQGPL